MGRDGLFSIDSLNGIYALVVDGDKERRNLVTGILRYCGALVTPVETPGAANAVMELLRPDVLIVDFASPSDGALTLIRGVRALKPEDGGMVPAVALGDDGTGAALARSHGFDAYVSRPLDPWELCRVITRLRTA
jgi:CheY-like chemotaxis protein